MDINCFSATSHVSNFFSSRHAYTSSKLSYTITKLGNTDLVAISEDIFYCDENPENTNYGHILFVGCENLMAQVHPDTKLKFVDIKHICGFAGNIVGAILKKSERRQSITYRMFCEANFTVLCLALYLEDCTSSEILTPAQRSLYESCKDSIAEQVQTKKAIIQDYFKIKEQGLSHDGKVKPLRKKKISARNGREIALKVNDNNGIVGQKNDNYASRINFLMNKSGESLLSGNIEEAAEFFSIAADMAKK